MSLAAELLWRQREVKRWIDIDHGTCDEGEDEEDVSMALFGWVLPVNNRQPTTPIFSLNPLSSPLSHQRSPSLLYILLALCLLARPSQSVFRVQCLCVSPPSDLRLQRTSTPRRVRAAHPSPCLVSLSLMLSLPPASPLLLCSTQRGTVCCTVSEPGAAVVVVVLPSTRTTHLHIRIQNTHHEG